MSTKKVVLIVTISVVSLVIIGFIGRGCIWLLTGPEGGVRLSNDMEEYALQYLEEYSILDPSENLIAYYDVTISLDGTEAAILTTKRVIYHKDGYTDSIDLKDITDIKHRKETMIGDIFEIYSITGKSFKIEIAPMNQGETFKNVLFKSWGSVKGLSTR